MRIVRLGKSNIKVPQLGFGGIPIQRLAESEAVDVVKKCLELGVTFLDTANGYTTSEERIGKAIQGKRDRVILATKTPALSNEAIEKNLELSLKRLNVKYIDLYQLHGVSNFKALDNVLSPNGALSVLGKAKMSGLIRHIGITSHQIDVAKKAVESDQFETVMFPINFVTPEAADKLIPACRKHDVGFIAMKPLAGGIVDNAGICFKYLLQFPDIVIIPGIEKITEIEEIHRIVEGPQGMTKEELAEMEKIKKDLGGSFCHRCDYCQPCTAQIPISMVLSGKSFYKRLPPEGFFGDMVASAMEKVSSCTDCGECEKRCPYSLPIRKMISEQAEWFESERKRFLNKN